MLHCADQGSCNPEAIELTTLPFKFQASAIMSNPNIDELGAYAIQDHKAFLQKFHDVDDAIRHDKLKKLLSHVLSPSWKTGVPVNQSDDPLLSVVIAYGKSKLAIDLIEMMPPDTLHYLMDGNFNDDTALHAAVARGDESVVEALVKKNEYLLRATNEQLESPLHKAALLGQRRIFWKLVELAREDAVRHVNLRREDGATVLHCAVMGNAPELALQIAKEYPLLMTSCNWKAVTPLQLMVTIPEAFRSQLHLGPFESLIYEWIPLEESSNERLERHAGEIEEISVHESSGPPYKDDECLQYVMTSRRKFPSNYATFFDMLELACIPVSTRIQRLELQKKKHKQAMELIGYLAGDPEYWVFIGRGRTPGHESDMEKFSSSPPKQTSESNENPPKQGKMSLHEFLQKSLTYLDRTKDSPLILDPKMNLHEFVKQILTYLDHTESKKNRWNESPLILGAKMGLYDFVKQILEVFPESVNYRDAEGRNVLQAAIQHGQEKIVDIIESMASGSNPVLPSWLWSSTEEETKNTILHFAAEEIVKENFPPLQMQYELQWFEKVKRLVPKDLEYSRNDEEKTAQELFTEKHMTMVQKGKEQLMEMGKTYSGLVAAVVFASSFSIPGEKDVNNNPVFLHKTAFKVFSHAYVIGLSCAATALVLFLSLLTSPYRQQEFRRSLPTRYLFANVSFFLALAALLVAFTCNIYLNIYGGRKAETKDIIPLICELTVFPAVCTFVLLYRGSSFGFGSFMRNVWR